MSRPVFGVDRMPHAWEDEPQPKQCADGDHLVDNALARCTVCGWLDPDVLRCQTVGCPFPAEYVTEMGPTVEGPAFTTIEATGHFCGRHALLGGVSLLPGASA